MPRQADVFRGRPPEAVFAPQTAAPHVVTTVMHYGPGREERITITRVGNWIREDHNHTGSGRKWIVFSDISSGTSFSIGLDDNGRYRSLSITRSRPTDSEYVSTRERTGQRETALGEDCEVWNMAAGKNYPTRLDCVTRDGITLWSRTSYGSSGIMRSEQALSVERRQSTPDYVRPPNEVFAWAYWSRLGEGATSTFAAAQDYEVTLSSAAGGDTRTIRRHFPWTYIDSVRPNGNKSLSIASRTMRLYFEADTRNQPISLSIIAQPEQPFPEPAPVRTKQPAQLVLGEVCTWFDTFPGARDIGSYECRTWDSIPLRITGITWGHTSLDLRATRITRRYLLVGAVAPPSIVFDWVH